VLFLENFLYWSDKTSNKDGWCYKSAAEIEEETGLSYEEQKTARRRLKQIGLLEEREERLVHRMYYRVNTEKLDELWGETLFSRTRDSLVRGEGIPSFGDEGIPRPLLNTSLTTSLTSSQLTVEVESSKAEKKDPINYQAFMDTWNNNIEGTPFPKIHSIAGKRKQTIAIRIKDYPTLLDMMPVVIRHMSKDPFFRGDNDRAWVANFDYLLQDGKMVQLYEKATNAAWTAPKQEYKSTQDTMIEAMERQQAEEFRELRARRAT
jgi:hypothetical protein